MSDRYISGTSACKDTCFIQGILGHGRHVHVMEKDISVTECQKLCQSTERCAFFTVKVLQDHSQICLLFPKHSEIILELEDHGVSISGPQFCQDGKFENPWGTDLNRGTLNLVESKMRHGEVSEQAYGHALVVDDVTFNSSASGAEIDDA